MPRRKPASAKQRKAELQLKRAIKRGDIPAPPPQPKPPRGKRPRRVILGGLPTVKASDPSSKRLQSAFLKVEPGFLENSRLIAATDPLPRPLSPETAVLDENEVGLRENKALLQLTCPKRPKWRFDMEKKEVERNEEAMYQKWLSEVDGGVQAWRTGESDDLSREPVENPPAKDANLDPRIKVPGSPTYFERNLEVWRQLWRVSEISQIMLLLLDSRCPALHFPPSLHLYLSSLKPLRPTILVLTKSDLVTPDHTAAWSAWLRERHPSVRVVSVESYRAQDVNAERKGQGQRKKFEPEMKEADLHELVGALKAAHAELLTPPEKIRNNEEKLKNWKPGVREAVDWEAALRGGHGHVEEPVDDKDDQEFITVGLVGQPNVGKSSLLNALFGTHKVKASRTPGKTKHFQTLFWTPHIRLVDCPGLVMPNYVRMELQVLCGILPISQIPSIPSCLHYALRLLPLEQMMHLTHPSEGIDIPQDKRTWRGERPTPRATGPATGGWTAMDVLAAYASNKGWVTAKAGRPDSNRAGNALLRLLAEGKIRWAFWPPGVLLPEDTRRKRLGIWLGSAVEHGGEEDDVSEAESTSEEEDEDEEEDGTSDEEIKAEEADEDHESEEQVLRVAGVGRFGALTIGDEPDDSIHSQDELG